MAVGSFMHLGNFNFHSIHAGLRANKVYLLNKQVSKYVVMVFFSSKISTVFYLYLLLVMDLCYHVCTLCI